MSFSLTQAEQANVLLALSTYVITRTAERDALPEDDPMRPRVDWELASIETALSKIDADR